MAQMRPWMPRARKEELVVEELPDETLVYDLKRHKAHCLNRTASAVWRHCDGRTSLSDMAEILEQELALPRDEAIVRFALGRLRKARLLDEGTDVSEEPTGLSRREVVRKLAVVGGLSILLPVVTSLPSPVAAMQASSTTNRACRRFCQGIGLPCRDRPGTTCVTRRGRCRCRRSRRRRR